MGSRVFFLTYIVSGDFERRQSLFDLPNVAEENDVAGPQSLACLASRSPGESLHYSIQIQANVLESSATV